MIRFLVKISKSIIYCLLLTFVLLTSIVLFLLTTTPGFYLTVKLVNAFLPGQLDLQEANGPLNDMLTIRQLSYHDKGIIIRGENVTLHCSLRQLLFHHRLIFKTLKAQQLTIQSTATTNTASSPLVIPQLPFAIIAQNARIDELVIADQNGNYSLKEVRIRTTLSNNRWQVSRFDFNYQKHQIHLSAQAQPLFPYPLNARMEIQPLEKNQGLKGSMRLTGNWHAYRWQGQFNGLSAMSVTGLLKKGQDVETRLQWQSLRWPLPGLKQPLSSPKGHVLIRGKIPKLDIEAEADIKTPLSSHLSLNIHAANKQQFNADGDLTLPHHQVHFTTRYDEEHHPKIQGNMTAHSLVNDLSDSLLQQIKAQATFAGDTFEGLVAKGLLTAQYNEQPLKIQVNYQKQTLSSQLSLAKNNLKIDGSKASSWQAEAMIPNPEILNPALTHLKTTLKLKAALSKTGKGHLILTIGKGYYQDPELQPLAFEGGEITAQLDTQALQAKGQFIIDPAKSATLALTLPQFQWSNLLRQRQRLESELTININSLDFIKEINSALAEPSGQLKAHLKASGLLHRPVFKGKLTLSQGRVSLPQLGIHLNPVNLTMETHNQQWLVNGELLSNNQPLRVKGEGRFAPILTGTLHLNGEQVPILNLDEYKMDLSPKLTFEFKPSHYLLTGELLIPRASIKPHTFDSSASLSSDVVYAGQKQGELNPFHIDSNVRLEMGQDVEIALKGLKGYLEGSLQLRQLPSGPMRATGELNVRDGKYHAYGQDLLIQQGQLIYTGSLIDNPDIKVRAIRQFNNASASFAGSNRLFDFNTENLQSYDFGNKTTVGIEVSGHLNTPKMQLFSIPSNLSQADILSMLLLGKPARQADKSGGQLLLAAISSMNLDSGSKGTQLLEQLKNNLGFDVNVENNTEYNRKTNETTDTTSFVVGKSLSNRLYLSYNMGFSQGSNNLLTLKYLLNKFFSIQVSASMSGSSGVDLLYTHQKD